VFRFQIAWLGKGAQNVPLNLLFTPPRSPLQQDVPWSKRSRKKATIPVAEFQLSGDAGRGAVHLTGFVTSHRETGTLTSAQEESEGEKISVQGGEGEDVEEISEPEDEPRPLTKEEELLAGPQGRKKKREENKKKREKKEKREARKTKNVEEEDSFIAPLEDDGDDVLEVPSKKPKAFLEQDDDEFGVKKGTSAEVKKDQKKEITVVKLPSGVQYQEVREGTGPESKPGNKLKVRYKGMLQNGKVFDSNMPRGQPFVFTLGEPGVIQGWNLGLAGMKKGGRRNLLIPAQYGYGRKGSPPTIPPNAPLIFEIELLSIS